jgi:hypothetical protein
MVIKLEIITGLTAKGTVIYTSHEAGCSAVGLARSVWDAEVGGSNPLTPTFLILDNRFLDVFIVIIIGMHAYKYNNK